MFSLGPGSAQTLFFGGARIAAIDNQLFVSATTYVVSATTYVQASVDTALDELI